MRGILLLLVFGFLILGGEEKMGDGGAGAEADSGIEGGYFGPTDIQSEIYGIGEQPSVEGPTSQAMPGPTISAEYGASGELTGATTGGTRSDVELSTPGLYGGTEVGKIKPKKEKKSDIAPATTPREGSGTESRKRRRSLLLEEEGGLLSPLNQAPVRRRSLFGT